MSTMPCTLLLLLLLLLLLMMMTAVVGLVCMYGSRTSVSA